MRTNIWIHVFLNAHLYRKEIPGVTCARELSVSNVKCIMWFIYAGLQRRIRLTKLLRTVTFPAFHFPVSNWQKNSTRHHRDGPSRMILFNNFCLRNLFKVIALPWSVIGEVIADRTNVRKSKMRTFSITLFSMTLT